MDVGVTVLPIQNGYKLPTGPRARTGPQGGKAWSNIKAVSDWWLARCVTLARRQVVTYMFRDRDMKPLIYRLYGETSGPSGSIIVDVKPSQSCMFSRQDGAKLTIAWSFGQLDLKVGKTTGDEMVLHTANFRHCARVGV